MRQLMVPPTKFRTVDLQTLATLTHDELRSAMEGAGLGGLVEPTWRSLARLRDGDASPEAVSAVTREALLVCEVLERTPPTVEQKLNLLEKVTGLDLDGDGDVGEAGAKLKSNAPDDSLGAALVADIKSGYEGTASTAANLNVLEAVTGLDLDRDGDVGQEGASAVEMMAELEDRAAAAYVVKSGHGLHTATHK